MKVHNSREVRFFFYFVIALIPILLISILCCCLDDGVFGITLKMFGNRKEALSVLENYFLVEVQVAFVVVSLSTALSASSKRVYWEESYSYRLISPRFTNFTALSAYILASLLDGLIWVVLERTIPLTCITGIMVSFAFSIIFMILLTARMIDANFGRETLKKQLRKDLERKEQDFPHFAGEDKGRSVHEIQLLINSSLREIDEKDFDLLTENLALLYFYDYSGSFKTIYEYIRETIHNKHIIYQINYSILREAILSKDAQKRRNYHSWLFTVIPQDEQVELWESIVKEAFDNSFVLWKTGKVEEAKEFRNYIYVVLSEYLQDSLLKIQSSCISEDGILIDMSEKERDTSYYPLIRIMAFLVFLRENITGLYLDDNDSELPGWTYSEGNFESEDTVMFIHEEVDEVIDRWNSNGIPECVEDGLTEDLFNCAKDY